MSATSQPFDNFKEALATHLVGDTDGLDDFLDYLASLAWEIVPASLRDATYELQPTPSEVDAVPLDALPVAFGETLAAYNVLPDVDADTVSKLLRGVLADYIADRIAPPRIGRATRSSVSACEICTRGDDEVFLSYHHLIPRSTHAMVRKRGMHPEERLQAVAWLCRGCHRMVHRIETNEELARNWFTVERLLQREDVQRWRAWASKQGTRKKR